MPVYQALQSTVLFRNGMQIFAKRTKLLHCCWEGNAKTINNRTRARTQVIERGRRTQIIGKRRGLEQYNGRKRSLLHASRSRNLFFFFFFLKNSNNNKSGLENSIGLGQTRISNNLRIKIRAENASGSVYVATR